MDELDLELSDFNQLIFEIMAVDRKGETHDNATDFMESNDFSLGNRRIELLKVGWRYGMKFQADMEQGLVNAFKNLIYKFVKVDGKEITEERLRDASDIDHQLTAVIYKRLGKLAFKWLISG